MSQQAVQEYLRAYADYGRDVKGWSPVTRATYIRRAKAAEQWLRSEGYPSLHRADTKSLTKYLFQTAPSPLNRNDIRATLVAYFGFCIYMGWREDNPAVALPRVPVPKTLPRFLEASPARRVEVCAEMEGPMEEALIKTFLYTGLRKSECRMLRWSDFTEDFTTVRVMGKGSKEREVPIHPIVATALRKWRLASMEAEWVWPSPRYQGRVIGGSHFADIIRAIGYAAEVGILNPHAMRHTYATQLLEEGVDIRTVQELLGHSSLETTQRYTRVRDPRKREAVNRLSFRPKDPPPNQQTA